MQFMKVKTSESLNKPPNATTIRTHDQVQFQAIEMSFRIFKNSKHYSPKTTSTLTTKYTKATTGKQNAYCRKARYTGAE